MNNALWILQVLLGLAFVGAGYNHGFNIEKARTQMQWMTAMPNNLLVFIGVSEILGGVGLILPAATGILPWLTPLAATGLALIMLLAAGFHLMRREYPNIAFNLILLALAVFVAYGRFALAPL
ncbi:MAG TPA: DoxX family protein [Anaerolineales bacterium]|nr:DoxX family protein [Anaerolineales bacterium]